MIEEYKNRSEVNIDPGSIAVVTTTFYPKWYPGPSSGESVDKVRGDLALTMVRAAKDKGYQVVVVDGADNRAFKAALEALNINLFPESEKGMSASRQQGFKEASMLEGVKVICWTEEKPSLVEDGLPQSAIPILLGNAHVVVPKRNEEFFKRTYPDFQVVFEQRSNHLWNTMLRRYGLREVSEPDLDVWFGPKIFKNSPDLLSIFLDKYRFNADPGLKFHEIMKPELWPNAIFFPVIAALHRGFRVTGVEVPYRHSTEQTALEKNSVEFKRKREIQQRNIILTSEFFIRNVLHLQKSSNRKYNAREYSIRIEKAA